MCIHRLSTYVYTYIEYVCACIDWLCMCIHRLSTYVYTWSLWYRSWLFQYPNLWYRVCAHICNKFVSAPVTTSMYIVPTSLDAWEFFRIEERDSKHLDVCLSICMNVHAYTCTKSDVWDGSSMHFYLLFIFQCMPIFISTCIHTCS